MQHQGLSVSSARESGLKISRNLAFPGVLELFPIISPLSWNLTSSAMSSNGGRRVLNRVGRLTFLKDKLKAFNIEVFGDVRAKKRELVAEIEGLDKLESEGRGNTDLVGTREALKNDLEDILLKERRSIGQKMKFKWAKEGDVNSKLFYKVANGRKQKNFTKEIEDDNGVVLRDQGEGHQFLLQDSSLRRLQ